MTDTTLSSRWYFSSPVYFFFTSHSQDRKEDWLYSLVLEQMVSPVALYAPQGGCLLSLLAQESTATKQ